MIINYKQCEGVHRRIIGIGWFTELRARLLSAMSKKVVDHAALEGAINSQKSKRLKQRQILA
jgi:hypothetical protein